LVFKCRNQEEVRVVVVRTFYAEETPWVR